MPVRDVRFARSAATFSLLFRARQSEPHARARKLSRVERELASLAPWAWDPLVGKHAPGNAMMRDFTEVAADKVVTTNTNTYDAFRFAAAAPDEETSEASKEERAGPASVASRKPAKTRAVGRSPLSRTPATAPPDAPAPSTAPRLSPADVVDATPLGPVAGSAGARARSSRGAEKRTGGAEKREREDKSGTKPVGPPAKARGKSAAVRRGGVGGAGMTKKRAGDASASAAEAPLQGVTDVSVGEDTVSSPARRAKKSKPRSAATRAPRFAVGKNLVDALERAVEPAERAATFAPGKENAPPAAGTNGEAPASAPGPGAGGRGAGTRTEPPLADLGEARRHREAALLAVAAAEADAEAAASAPAMTPSQRLLRAYYDLTGVRTPAAAPPPPPAAPPRPVCVTVGPFPGAFEPSSLDAYERLPARVVPLTACVARACDYLGRRDAEEARRARARRGADA